MYIYIYIYICVCVCVCVCMCVCNYKTMKNLYKNSVTIILLYSEKKKRLNWTKCVLFTLPNERKTNRSTQLKRWQYYFLYIWINTVNLSLCEAMKAREWLEVYPHIFLTSILDGGGMFGFTYGSFDCHERALCTGSQGRSGHFWRKFCCPIRNRNKIHRHSP